MTIQDLFAKLSKPGQKRVQYGIYWAINKMNQCETKSHCDNFRHTFQQWVSYSTANFILPKLHDFTANGRNYVGIANIDGDTVSVTYTTGMANGNVRLTVTVHNANKVKEEAEEKERIEKENAIARNKELEIWTKIGETINDMYKKNKQTTKEECMDVVLSKFDEKDAYTAFKACGWVK